MIIIGMTHNLLYPTMSIMSIIFTFLRKADNIEQINYKGSFSLTLIMFLSEIISDIFFLL